jgi:ATP-dependent DNA helicase RecG
MTLEDIKKDNYQPKHRNKLLAEAFYLMGEVEKYGTGLIRIRQQLENYDNLSFNLERQSGSIVSTIFDNSENVGENVGEKVGEKPLTENRQQIIEAIRENKNITIKELSEIVGIAEKNIENNLKVLKSQGIIERIGPAKGGYWQIISE